MTDRLTDGRSVVDVSRVVVAMTLNCRKRVTNDVNTRRSLKSANRQRDRRRQPDQRLHVEETSEVLTQGIGTHHDVSPPSPSLSLSLSLSLPLSCSFCLAHSLVSLSLSLSLSLPVSPFLAHFFVSLSLSLTLSPPLLLILSCSFSHSQPLSLFLPLSLSQQHIGS